MGLVLSRDGTLPKILLPRTARILALWIRVLGIEFYSTQDFHRF